MTDQERQALREWSAGKMGWTHHWEIRGWTGTKQWYWLTQERNKIRNWRPDTDLNQCFMLVEKMRELGWAFGLWCHARGKDYCAKFTEDTGVTGNIIRTKENNSNPALAILKAARATEET